MFAFLGTIVVGLIVGLIARAMKPGDDKLGWIMTIVLGIAGAFLARYVGVAMGWYAPGAPAGCYDKSQVFLASSAYPESASSYQNISAWVSGCT